MLLRAYLLLPLLRAASAVFADEAGVVDFHYSLLGTPTPDSTFFHQPIPGAPGSLLFAASEQGLIGAVTPKEGLLVWRQQFENATSSTPLRALQGLDILLSGSAQEATAWVAADGKLAWKTTLPGAVVDVRLHHDGAYAVSGGPVTTVQKLALSNGKPLWSFEDASGDEPYGVTGAQGKTFLVSFQKSMLRGLKTKVVELDASTGTKLSETVLSSESEIYSRENVVAIGSYVQGSFIAWTDADFKTLKYNSLGTKTVHDLRLPATDLERVDFRWSSTGYSLVVESSNAAETFGQLYRFAPNTRPEKTRNLGPLNGRGTIAVNTLDEKDFFTIITPTNMVLEDRKGIVLTWKMPVLSPGNIVDKPLPVFATVEVMTRPAGYYAVRAAVLLSSGDWVLVRDGELVWVRPEALAGIVGASWAELSEDVDIIPAADVNHPIRSLFERIHRHFDAFQDWVVNFDKLFPSLKASLLASIRQSNALDRSFGFNKLIIAATRNGRFVALDVGAQGRVIWNLPASDKCTPPTPWVKGSIPSIAEALECMGEIPGTGSPTWLDTVLLQKPKLVVEDARPERAPGQAHFLLKDGQLNGFKGTEKTWGFVPYSGFRIHSVASRQLDEPVALIGKVMGDRRVLYKYLNPNAIAVISVNDDRKMAAVHLVDAVSGNTLYDSHIPNVDTTKTIAAAMSEHWLAFSFTMETSDDTVSKGFQLAMVEFYESRLANDRGRFGSLTNFSLVEGHSPVGRPAAYIQSYHIPEGIASLAVTQTAQGITSRNLLAVLPHTNSIVDIPRQALDPRRTIGRDPSADEQAEGLSKYAPMIDFDPRWYLSHREQVAVSSVMTTPALLESTSLVFAHGHDLFGSRVTPSFAFDMLGKSFNKIQLCLTVVALLVGVFVVRPLIQRKQTNMLWQA